MSKDRILITSPTFPPQVDGLSNSVYSLALSLKKNGFKITVATYGERRSSSLEKNNNFFIERFNIISSNNIFKPFLGDRLSYLSYLENFKLIPRLITITSGIIFLQFAALYENKLCNYEKPFVSGEGTYCKLLDKTKITFPSKYVWNNYKNLKRAFKNRTTSGTAADNMDIVKKRFGSFDKGFSFFPLLIHLV